MFNPEKDYNTNMSMVLSQVMPTHDDSCWEMIHVSGFFTILLEKIPKHELKNHLLSQFSHVFLTPIRLYSE